MIEAYPRDKYSECTRVVPVEGENLEQRIARVATIENAERYAEARDKFEFCRGLLGLTAYGCKTEYAVADLISEFDSLNNHGMTLADARQDAEQMQAAERANECALEGITNY